MVFSSRSRISFALALGVIVTSLAVALPRTAAFAAVTDNMFKTANTDWNCSDGISYDPDGLFCQSDNATLTAYLAGSLTSGSKASVRVALGRYDTTDLNTNEVSTAVYGGSAETDIIYGQNPGGLSGTTIGRAWCNDAVSSYRCDQHYVRFRYDDIVSALACHETGHTVGLTHGKEASPKLAQSDTRLNCMVTPLVNSLKYLGGNNADNINSTY